mgnify:CR=1 FL=1
MTEEKEEEKRVKIKLQENVLPDRFMSVLEYKNMVGKMERKVVAVADLIIMAKYALVDFEKILKEYEFSGDKKPSSWKHPACQTIEQLRIAIQNAAWCFV